MVQRVNNFLFIFYSSCFSIFYISGSLAKSVPFSPFKNFIFFVKNNNIIFKSIWPWWASKKFFAPSLFERWRWQVASPRCLYQTWTAERVNPELRPEIFFFERWRWQVASLSLSLSNLNYWTGESRTQAWNFFFERWRWQVVSPPTVFIKLELLNGWIQNLGLKI